MPKKFETEQKMEAFRLLFETFGDTAYVSREIGISERALQYWKSKYRLQVKLAVQEPIDPQERHYRDQYARLRDSVLEQIDLNLKIMSENPTADIQQKLSPTLSRLIDRIHKLERMIDDKHFYFTVLWLNPEDLEADEYIIRHHQLFEF